MIGSGVFIQVNLQKMLGIIGASVPIFFCPLGPVSRILSLGVFQRVVLVPLHLPHMLLKLELRGAVNSTSILA